VFEAKVKFKGNYADGKAISISGVWQQRGRVCVNVVRRFIDQANRMLDSQSVV